jgi:hypothetical protein
MRYIEFEKNSISMKISSILVATKADIAIPIRENKSVIDDKTYSFKEQSNIICYV